jgi:hypothetical protein
MVGCRQSYRNAGREMMRDAALQPKANSLNASSARKLNRWLCSGRLHPLSADNRDPTLARIGDPGRGCGRGAPLAFHRHSR